MNLASLVVEATLTSFRVNKNLAEKAVAQVSDERLFTPLDANTNSIAIIMKHVGGNLRSRWTDFLTSDGEKPWRNRDDEFTDTFKDRRDVFTIWEAGYAALFETLTTLTADDWLRTVTIRGEAISVPLAIQRSLAHTNYHVGQIVLTARLLAEGPWETLTIPRGQSAQHNKTAWGRNDYSQRAR
jgi:hypothetical protein